MTGHTAASSGGHRTPEQPLQAIAGGINAGDMDALLRLYESGAVFADQPGSFASGLAGVESSLAAFLAMCRQDGHRRHLEHVSVLAHTH